MDDDETGNKGDEGYQDVGPELEPYVTYFRKPVAVQLKVPLLGVEAMMEVRDVGEGRRELLFPLTEGLGCPTLALERDQEGKPLADKVKMEVVLFGEIRPSPCGTMLVLMRATDVGAWIATSIPPRNVDYVTTVVKVPPPEVIKEESRLVAP